MNRFTLCLAVVGLLLATRPGLAQQAGQRQAGADAEATPTATTMLRSANDVLAIVDSVMGLTGAQDQRQIPVIKDYLDIFLIGIDKTKPMRMDLITEANNPLRYRPSFPVNNIQQFTQNNLAGLGINNRRVAGALWSLNGAFVGFMRYHQRYASFAERPFANQDLPANLPDPTLELHPLLGKQYDAGALLRNEAPGVQFRHMVFTNQVRPELMKSLQPLENESEEDFALRKLLYEHRLEELQRYYAEASYAELGGRVLRDQPIGRFDGSVTPIPNTSLEQSIQQLGNEPSYFAAIPQSQDPILTARVNFPLDDMRRENMQELWDLLRSTRKKHIDAETEPTPEQREARKKVVDLIFDLLSANTRSGLVDAFAEAHPNPSGKHTAVGGFRSVDGTAAVEILKATAEAHPERKIEFGVDKAGNVEIHTYEISEERRPSYEKFFGSATVFIGTSKEAVWLAAGENALDELKAAIEQAGEQGGDSPPPTQFVNVYAKLLPWLELQSQQPEPAGPANPKIDKYRDMALDAFRQGNDELVLQVARAGNDIQGFFEVRAGILRFIGKAMADFSRENLEDEQAAPQAGAGAANPPVRREAARLSR